MYFLRDYQNYRTQTRGCVVTIGNFDGIHLGHQHMINEVKNAAKINSLPSVIITFEPLPKEFLQTDNMVDRLLTLKEKLSIIPRTAGTSLAGQCVGSGIIVDVSKHFNNGQ